MKDAAPPSFLLKSLRILRALCISGSALLFASCGELKELDNRLTEAVDELANAQQSMVSQSNQWRFQQSEARPTGHLDIQEHQIGRGSSKKILRRRNTLGLAKDPHTVVRFEQPPQYTYDAYE